ncbi:MAG: hypothetical protein JST00_34895 [Deltaproteobacteria bacterium]|nr:hypothetical protein [Deltaproteobacteria bacterium]
MPRSLVASFAGSTPLEGWGTVPDGRSFYFRARYEAWSLSLGATDDEAIEAPTWFWREPWGDAPYGAGYMPEETGREIFESCVDMIEAGIAPPVEYAGADPEEVAAQRFARMMVDDVCSYHGDAIRSASSAERALAAVASQLAEARELFRARTSAAHHACFEEALVHVDACREGRVVHPRWILDETSARAVAKRWRAMIARAHSSRAVGIREEGARWLELWAPAGPVREAWRAILL